MTPQAIPLTILHIAISPASPLLEEDLAPTSQSNLKPFAINHHPSTSCSSEGQTQV